MGNAITRRAFMGGVGATAVAMTGLVGCAPKSGNEMQGETLTDTDTWDKECDVVVVGSGSGLLAAVEAADAGAEVVLLEKGQRLGGETSVSCGDIYAAGTEVQKSNGFDDDFDAVWQWYLDNCNPEGSAEIFGAYDEEFIKQVLRESGAGVDRLSKLGMEFNIQADDNTAPRAHLMQPNAGAWVNILQPAAEERGVEIFKQNPATELVVDANGSVVGVVAEDSGKPWRIKARKGVILATGDCSSADDIKNQYMDKDRASVPGMVDTNTGDGLKMAAAIGAGLAMNSRFETRHDIKTMFEIGNNIEDPVFLKGAILVNEDGERFVNETDAYAMAVAVNKLNGQPVYCVFGKPVADKAHWVDPLDGTALMDGTSMSLTYVGGIGYTYIEDAAEKGFLFQGETVEELAAAIGVSPERLKATIGAWNDSVEKGNDEAFGHAIEENVSDLYGPTSAITAPYYALKSTGARNIIQEGPNLLVSLDYQVTDFAGEPIERLYACGAGLTQGSAPHVVLGGGTHLCNGVVGARIAAANVVALDPIA